MFEARSLRRSPVVDICSSLVESVNKYRAIYTVVHGSHNLCVLENRYGIEGIEEVRCWKLG